MAHDSQSLDSSHSSAGKPSSPFGASLPRREDAAVLNGRGQYVSDLAPDGCLHAVFVRSPMASARIVSIDTEAARAMPGVRLIVTSDMLSGLAPLAVNPVVDGLRAFACPILATARVDSVGAPIALVVASTATQARDAAEAVFVDLASEAALPDYASAVAGDAFMPGWPDNRAFEKRWTQGDFDAVASAAHRTVHVRVASPRVAAVALEPRGLLADWQGGKLTVSIPTQSPHRARMELARVLGLSLEQVRTIAPDVGGAFGSKASVYPEDVAVCFAAMQLGAPVKWISSRNEDFVSASHGRDSTLEAWATFDAGARLQGLKADLRYVIGSWATFSAVVPTWNAARILPGPYRVEAIDITATTVVAHTAPVGIYRGAGRPEAALLMERIMDAAAREFDIDVAEIRRRNLIATSDLPFNTPTGQRLDSGDYCGLLDKALEAAGYERLRVTQAARRAAGELVGIGINLYVEPCGTGWESARITRHADGSFTVASGSSAQGQGHRTAFAQIAADALGVPMDRVTVIEGDSDTSPAGIGALASRSMAIGGSAVLLAAQEMRGKCEAHVKQAGSGADDVESSEVVEVETVYTAPHETWSAGCCLAVVVVDRDTGLTQVEQAVWADDAGRVINPLLAVGQLMGGFAQGLGQALMERIHYDEDGQLLTGSLMDYALPRATDIPPLALHSLPSATDANALGAKGVGESGCIAAPAAILNAAIDALAPLGVRHLDMPLTSENVWRAMQDAENAAENATEDAAEQTP